MWHFLYCICFSRCFLVFPSVSLSICKMHCMYNWIIHFKNYTLKKIQCHSGQQARQLILPFFLPLHFSSFPYSWRWWKKFALHLKVTIFWSFTPQPETIEWLMLPFLALLIPKIGVFIIWLLPCIKWIKIILKLKIKIVLGVYKRNGEIVSNCCCLIYRIWQTLWGFLSCAFTLICNFREGFFASLMNCFSL